MSISMKLKEGYITYYTCGSQTDPEQLLDGLAKAGYTGFKPKKRTWLMSLKAALAERFKDEMVRPLEKRDDNGYTVVKETKGKTANLYDRLFNAKVTMTGGVDLYNVDPSFQGKVAKQDLQDRTDHFHSVLPGDSVSKLLVEIIKNKLDGISIRDGGCIYFLPEENINQWRKVCSLVSLAAVGGTQNKFTSLQMERTDETLRDIKDSIITEVTTKTAEIRADLSKNDLGDRAITNRVNRSLELAKRVQFYEGMLGEALETCRDALTKTEQAVALSTAQEETRDVFDDMFDPS